MERVGTHPTVKWTLGRREESADGWRYAHGFARSRSTWNLDHTPEAGTRPTFKSALREPPGIRSWLEVGTQLPKLTAYLPSSLCGRWSQKADVDVDRANVGRWLKADLRLFRKITTIRLFCLLSFNEQNHNLIVSECEQEGCAVCEQRRFCCRAATPNNLLQESLGSDY